MIIKDLVYGKEEILEPILLDLIDSKEFQRLKNVSQLGLPDEYYMKKGFSRYDHSLGVLILLRRLGADLEEQIVGLLHDVNHTAFSHVVDWIEGDPSLENHQDDTLFDYLINSAIPGILERHGFDINIFQNYKNYTFLEKEAPSICADRIDYCLREVAVDGNVNLSKEIYLGLIGFEHQVVFNDSRLAKKFYEEYSSLNKNCWSSSDARMRYYLISQAIKKAFKLKILSMKDLFLDELEIISKLYDTKDVFILEKLSLLKNGFDLYEDDSGILLEKKFRFVDPEILIEGKIMNLSDFDISYKSKIEEQMKEDKFPLRMVAKSK